MLLDVIILATMAYMAYRWAKVGLVYGFFSLMGFVLGILLGSWLIQFFPNLIGDSSLRLLITMSFIVLSGLIVGGIGEHVGRVLSSKTERKKLRQADSILGALFSIVLAGAVVWMFAAILSTSPFQTLNRAFQESSLVQSINRAFPPAPPVLARIGSDIKPFEFPQVFVGPEPAPVAPVAPTNNATLANIVDAVGTSVVRIEANGCGGQSRGSGFVAAQNTIVTNAHVVAGSNNVTVSDTFGRRRATVIYFNPDLDIAVLSAVNLAGQPLALVDTLSPRGTQAGALGFPGGGNFRANGATVLRSLQARGLNIYGTRNVTRPIYELQTIVVQGNSGGPVVTPDGRVIAVVFARSETNGTIGYGITAPAVKQALAQALAGGGAPVSTSACVAD